MELSDYKIEIPPQLPMRFRVFHFSYYNNGAILYSQVNRSDDFFDSVPVRRRIQIGLIENLFICKYIKERNSDGRVDDRFFSGEA